MSRFTFVPALSLRGRRSWGPRGFAGKPTHPPLTDLPIAAYLFAAVFDVLSLIVYDAHPAVGEQLYRAGTWVLLGGAAAAVLAVGTGILDWMTTPPRTQVRRTANAHWITMVAVNLVVVVDLLLRLTGYRDETYSEPPIVALSVLAALLVTLGAAIGGSLVYDYGMRVEPAANTTVGREPDRGPGQPDRSPRRRPTDVR
ncbi:DUF2231 domain-containing protein [Longispora sp. K20-0274]|uniref:DUF2231 domain-containing protein n=1 Tax=Longispora sp. K20-0274 TaxID=3088255 RepID=UPI00399BFD2D